MTAVRLELESGVDTLPLDGVAMDGRGVQAVLGASGFGLPPKQVQWLEGAGDGARARGWRALPRDIDLPLTIVGTDEDDLQYWVSRLASVLGYNHDNSPLGPDLYLHFYDHDGSKWTTSVEHVGGGDYNYGKDNFGDRSVELVITLRAGNPYFTSADSVTTLTYFETKSGAALP